MPYFNHAVRGVKAFFGPRTANEGLVGVLDQRDGIATLVVEFTGRNINDDSFQFNLGTLPAGAKVLRAITVIDEAFVLGGTTPTIDIGTDGTEGTNGFDLTEAQGEAVDTYEDTTFAGTWADELAAETIISVALGGSTPTVTDAGSARVIIEYANFK